MTVRGVLCDIEGTTTSISFVYDTLMPYASQQVGAFLERNAPTPAVAACCQELLALRTAAEASIQGLDGVVAVVRRLMAADIKSTPLKTLQGLIWEEGYARGAITGHVYADVPTFLARSRAAGIAVAIYSSGSRLAQRLLFRHSLAGDLSPYLAGYYDTTSGPKRAPASYTAIAAAWGLPAPDICFCTDIPEEARAALEAGLQAILLMRPGNAPLPAQQPCPVHADFTRIGT
jgi:enolase-phosphatase E1